VKKALLSIFLISVSLTACSPGVKPEPVPALSSVINPYNVSADLLNFTNQARQKAGKTPLKSDPRLVKSAQLWALECARMQKLTHFGKGVNATPWSRMQAQGVTYKSASENAAAWQTSAQQVVNDWLSDPPHKANVLGPWSHCGAGAASKQGKIYWVMDYAQEL
jgi:uncharacterized protein YkwD